MILGKLYQFNFDFTKSDPCPFAAVLKCNFGQLEALKAFSSRVQLIKSFCTVHFSSELCMYNLKASLLLAS